MNSKAETIAEVIAGTVAAVLTTYEAVHLGATVGGHLGLITALSPFALFNITAAVSATLNLVLFTALFALFHYMNDDEALNKSDFKLLGASYIASIVIGVGISAVVSAAFPCETELVAALGGAVGTVALIASFLAAKYIIMPAVEKVKECFSSQDKE